MPVRRPAMDWFSWLASGATFAVIAAAVLWVTRFAPTPDEQWKTAPVALRQQVQKFLTCATRTSLPASINGSFSICGLAVRYRGPGTPLARCLRNPKLRNTESMAPSITETAPTLRRIYYTCGRGWMQIEAEQWDSDVRLTAVNAGAF